MPLAPTLQKEIERFSSIEHLVALRAYDVKKQLRDVFLHAPSRTPNHAIIHQGMLRILHGAQSHKGHVPPHLAKRALTLLQHMAQQPIAQLLLTQPGAHTLSNPPPANYASDQPLPAQTPLWLDACDAGQVLARAGVVLQQALGGEWISLRAIASPLPNLLAGWLNGERQKVLGAGKLLQQGALTCAESIQGRWHVHPDVLCACWKHPPLPAEQTDAPWENKLAVLLNGMPLSASTEQTKPQCTLGSHSTAFGAQVTKGVVMHPNARIVGMQVKQPLPSLIGEACVLGEGCRVHAILHAGVRIDAGVELNPSTTVLEANTGQVLLPWRYRVEGVDYAIPCIPAGYHVQASTREGVLQATPQAAR